MSDSSRNVESENERTIEVFCRVRPTKKLSRLYSLEDNETITFNVPHEQSAGVVNNQKEIFQFPFAQVFDQHVKQEDIFDHVAKKVVNNVIDGYNGTIFAYGQTGSGKTFTITGGPEHYSDRGVIPRSINAIFSHIDANRSQAMFAVHISYLEIYNNNGYDLLDPDHDNKKLEDLQKVVLMDDENGNTRLSHISVQPASSAEDALNWLFIGDTNRVICETPMNDASSRSHCIFMIALETRCLRTDMIRRSRLNLVDLAGSERTAKTQVDGRILTEARAINLSLHYLEQCIVALHEKAQGKRVHVPYRNSMITSILKDSLGGNCKTVMIANINADDSHVIESISTCRFAQRVAMISNSATINEELDPSLIIQRLKHRVEELEARLSVYEQGESGTAAEDASRTLDPHKISQLELQIDGFLDRDDDGLVSALIDLPKGQLSHSFLYLKRCIKSNVKQRLAGRIIF
uniref:Kinesin-like protein n=1 Tax=Spongospora subterranea TaxID=70186 RepID=A0A0H5QJR4_9EUKA|eukprot:CRZ02325.1 hypothetical protein [Spongospora subterranea]